MYVCTLEEFINLGSSLDGAVQLNDLNIEIGSIYIILRID